MLEVKIPYARFFLCNSAMLAGVHSQCRAVLSLKACVSEVLNVCTSAAKVLEPIYIC